MIKLRNNGFLFKHRAMSLLSTTTSSPIVSIKDNYWRRQICVTRCGNNGHVIHSAISSLNSLGLNKLCIKKLCVCVFVHRGAAVNGEIPLAHFNPTFHNPQGLNKCTNIIYCNAPSLGGFSP